MVETEIVFEGAVLWATPRGEMDLDGYVAMRGAVMQRAIESEARAILLDLRTVVLRVSTLDVYNAAAGTISSLPPGIRYAILVSEQTAAPSLVSFGENVAVNRGASLRAFSCLESAQRWLGVEADVTPQ